MFGHESHSKRNRQKLYFWNIESFWVPGTICKAPRNGHAKIHIVIPTSWPIRKNATLRHHGFGQPNVAPGKFWSICVCFPENLASKHAKPKNNLWKQNYKKQKKYILEKSGVCFAMHVALQGTKGFNQMMPLMMLWPCFIRIGNVEGMLMTINLRRKQ